MSKCINGNKLFRDENMLESGKETNFISARPYEGYDENKQRVYAKYNKGNWITEAQVFVDGKWYVASRNTLQSKPETEYEYTGRKRPVESNHTMFSDLSTFWRIILTPIYGIIFMYFCLSGKDINLQILDDRE